MTKRNGVISCSLFLLLTITFDNAAAKSAEVSAISLDVLRVKACAAGQGCSTVGGPKQWNLFDLAEGKTDFANQVLMPAKTHELRLMLGSKSTITVDGQTYPLTVPSGQVSGLKLKGNKVFASASGFLKSIRLNFDLAKALVVQAKKVKGKGKKDKDTLVYSYSLKPVIQVSSAEVTPMPENMAAVVALPEKDVVLTLGDDFSLSIPAGATSDPVVITSEEINDSVYKLNPDGYTFHIPVAVNINYSLSAVNDLGYTEDDLTMLRNGVVFPSLIDINTKKVTAYTVRFSTYAVGISNYTSSSLGEDNDTECTEKLFPSTMSSEELELKLREKLESVDGYLSKNFIKMYLEMKAANKLNDGHQVCGYRTEKTAHRFSTGSAIYNYCVTLDDLKEWSKTDRGGDGKDEDETIWYKKEWESEVEDECTWLDKIIYFPYSCEHFYLESYAREQAKKNVSEIVNAGKCKYGICAPDTVTYAQEGYNSGTKEREPNNDSMEISSHVQGKAIDLKGLDWSKFQGGAWGSEVTSLAEKYHLVRPFNKKQDGACSPIQEHWHFQLSPDYNGDDEDDDNGDTNAASITLEEHQADCTGTEGYWHDQSVGSEGKSLWTYNNDEAHGVDNYCTYSFTGITPRKWKVKVFIPSNHANTGHACYEIDGGGQVRGAEIDQSPFFDEWVTLGVFESTGNSMKVRLTDMTGEAYGSKWIGFDAIKIEPAPDDAEVGRASGVDSCEPRL